MPAAKEAAKRPCARARPCVGLRMRGAECASGKNSSPPMQTLQRRRCQTRARSRKKGCAYGVGVSGATIFAYVEGNPLSFVDPEGLQTAPITHPIVWLPPLICAAIPGCMETITKPINDFIDLCMNRGGSWPSWPPSEPTPGGPPKNQCDRQYESDSAICRALPSSGQRGRCWESAADRLAACIGNTPIPPLSKW